MAERLVSIVDLVRAKFSDPREALGPASAATNHAAIGELTDSRWFVGGRFVRMEAAPPRIVVAPAQGAFRQPKSAGYVKDAAGSDHRLAQRFLSVRWLLWGRDPEEAEAMMHLLIVAIAASPLKGWGVSIEDETWPIEIEESALRLGSVVELATSIPLDVLASDVRYVLRPVDPNPPPGAGFPLTPITTFATQAFTTDAPASPAVTFEDPTP